MTRPVRVLFLTGSMGAGGSEAHLARLLPSLDRDRVEPELVLMRADRGHANLARVEAAGVPVEDLDVGVGRAAIAGAFLSVRRALRSKRPDIVHAYGYPADLYALFGARRTSTRVVTSRRGNQQRARRRQLYRLTGWRADAVVCVSESARRFAIETEGMNGDRAVVIPNGIDPEGFPPRTRREGAPVRIGTHARLRHIKGIDLLLDAFTSLEVPGLKLVIAGPVLDEWGRSLVDRHRANPDIEFVGEIDDSAAFLRSLDLYVLPSRSEGMSMSLLEALAVGLPVVATDVGSNREVLDDGRAGVVVLPEANGLASGIGRLLEDEALRTRLGSTARERIEREFTHELMVRRFEAFYERIARR